MQSGKAKAGPCEGAQGRCARWRVRPEPPKNKKSGVYGCGPGGRRPQGDGGARRAPGTPSQRVPREQGTPHEGGRGRLPRRAPEPVWPRPRNCSKVRAWPASPHVTRPGSDLKRPAPLRPSARGPRPRAGLERRRGQRRRRGRGSPGVPPSAGTAPGGVTGSGPPGPTARRQPGLPAPAPAPHLLAVEAARKRLPPRTTSVCPHRASPAEPAMRPPAAPPPTCAAESHFLPAPNNDVTHGRRGGNARPAPRRRRPWACAEGVFCFLFPPAPPSPLGGPGSVAGRFRAVGMHARVSTLAEPCSWPPHWAGPVLDLSPLPLGTWSCRYRLGSS